LQAAKLRKGFFLNLPHEQQPGTFHLHRATSFEMGGSSGRLPNAVVVLLCAPLVRFS